MSFWTLERVTAALSGMVEGARPGGSEPLGGITTDTRAIDRGDVFVALAGERFDAHDFLGDAVGRGAAALVVADARRAAGAGVPVFAVDDTLAALGALGMYRRRSWGRPVIAVAGSNGKTSTKELLAAALRSRFVVHATPDNYNNQVGVPLTLLAIPDEADLSVIEIGTDHPGEVAALRTLAEPSIAVVTSVGEEHLEGLGDLVGVLREESEVARDASLAITPADQPEIGEAARRLAGGVVEAGLERGDICPESWGLTPRATGWMILGGVRFDVPLAGLHNLRNALLAIAVARACGIADEDSARAIAAVPQLDMRSSLETLGTMVLFNDAYNANPASAREALATFDAIETQRPRVAVLGSMLELGATSAALHSEIALRALASRASVIAGVGEFEKALRESATNDPRVITASDADAIWPALRERLAPNALVLLKGSRGTRLERLVPRLREFAGLPPAGAGGGAPH